MNNSYSLIPIIMLIVSMAMFTAQIYSIVCMFQISSRHIVCKKERVDTYWLIIFAIVLSLIFSTSIMFNNTYYSLINLYILSGMIIYMAIPIIWKKHLTNSKSLNIFIVAGNTYAFSSLSSALFIQTHTPSILGYILILIAIASFIVLVSAIHRVKVNAQETNHVTVTPARNYTKYLLITGVGIYISALILNFLSIRVLYVYFPYNIFVTPYMLSILSSCLASLIFYCYFANTCTSKRVFWFFIIYLSCMTILQSFVIMLVNSLMLGYGLFNAPGVIFIYILLEVTH
jgi:hypothetical protein